MSEQVKTIVAYVFGVSVLLLAWSFFKTWEPPLPVMSGTAIAIPHRTGGLPPSQSLVIDRKRETDPIPPQPCKGDRKE